MKNISQMVAGVITLPYTQRIQRGQEQVSELTQNYQAVTLEGLARKSRRPRYLGGIPYGLSSAYR